MRKLQLLIISIIFLFSQTVFGVSITSASFNCNITTTLRVGSKGADVECLQSALNLTADGIFGPKTKAAVIAWQADAGLTADGIFGAKSLAVFAGSSVSTIYLPGCTGTMGYSITTGTKCDSSIPLVPTTPSSTVTSAPLVSNDNNSNQPEPSSVNTNSATNSNPNLVNLDKLITTVVSVSKEKGVNEKDIKHITDTITQIVMNTKVDLNKEFEKVLAGDQLSYNVNTKTSLSVFDNFVIKSLSFLGITPSVAHAATGEAFGGKLLYSFFCSDSGNWMITIDPLPPNYVALLSYTPGTEEYASYNIPETTELLGTYTEEGECDIPDDPDISISTEGTIGAVTGSSAS